MELSLVGRIVSSCAEHMKSTLLFIIAFSLSYPKCGAQESQKTSDQDFARMLANESTRSATVAKLAASGKGRIPLLISWTRNPPAQMDKVKLYVGLVALACLGIVGLVTYAVWQLTMAPGARPAHVVAAVTASILTPCSDWLGRGRGSGSGGRSIATPASRTLWHQPPRSARLRHRQAYVPGIGVFAITAVLAAWWPARRALRIDPLHALRYE